MDEQQKRLIEELLFSVKKKPSFAKMLYFGILDDSQIFPYPKPREPENGFLQKVQDFANREIDGNKIDREQNIPSSVIEGLGKLGVLGMTIPKEYGGMGLSQYAYCKSVEAIARRCGSTALFVNAHQSIGLKALLLFGTDEQRKKWLAPLARGEQLAAFALTEPNAGSDASGIETRAEYDPTKKVYRINGRKQWITNGAIAQILTVMAKTGDKITAFLVTPDMPGFKVVAESLEKVGMRGSKTAILDFNDVEVPEENILGPIGGGLRVCLTVLDYGRTTFGATCVGAGKYLQELAIEHARNRYQFKRPLATFGLVKKKIANIAALNYAMDATTYMTAGLVDNEVEDFMLESAILKVFASDSLWQILYDTMQIFGGRSFFTDAPLERMMRDARLNMIGEGSNEVMRAFIGVIGMRDVGVQFKGFADALKDPFKQTETLWRFAKQKLYATKAPRVPVNSPLLSQEAKQLGRSIRSFGFQIAKLLATYREDIVEKQLLLDRVANSAMAIYTIASVLSKLDADLKKGNLGNDLEIGKYYCRMAFDSLHQNLNGLFNNYDEAIEALSDKMTGARIP